MDLNEILSTTDKNYIKYFNHGYLEWVHQLKKILGFKSTYKRNLGFLRFFILKERWLHSLGWLQTHDFLASAVQVLESQMCTTTLNQQRKESFILGWRVFYLCTICVQYSWGPEEGGRSPGFGATDSCRPQYGFWELNTGPAEEHLVFLTTESSLAHQKGK